MKTAAPLILCLALAACGGAPGAAVGDAGPPDAGTPDTGSETHPTQRSFNVVATMGLSEISSSVPTNEFTLVLDMAAGTAIAGGGGQARSVALTTTDGRTFHVGPAFSVGLMLGRCASLVRLQYDGLDFTIAGDRLTGSAVGHPVRAGGNVGLDGFAAALVGQPDTTPPFIIVPEGAITNDPLTDFQVWTSEPLPPTALARIVGGDGAVSGLVPELVEGDVPLIATFGKPSVTLPPGQTFRALYSDDVVDLAGNVAPFGDAVRLASVAPAPLVPPDGFESATDAMVGGAVIVREGEGVPIAGGASAYLGQEGSPTPAGLTRSPKLVVRLAVPPGATKLHFSYRELAFGNKAPLGFVQLGSVGRTPGPETPIPTPATFEQVTTRDATFDESPVATMDVVLPDELGAELVVVIRLGPAPCDQSFGSPGLLIDDLRID